MIGIIDYGLGNINAFVNVYKKLGFDTKIIKEPSDFLNCTKLILPGVGHFDYAMSKFNDSGLKDIFLKKIINEKMPILGVCVGMQMLADVSEEGSLKGLGLISGKVKKFDVNNVGFLPHMGWNNFSRISNYKILDGINEKSFFYFLHSYYYQCSNPNNIILHTKYHIEFASMIKNENIYGAQFHAEKSHSSGVRLLRNFAKI